MNLLRIIKRWLGVKSDSLSLEEKLLQNLLQTNRKNDYFKWPVDKVHPDL